MPDDSVCTPAPVRAAHRLATQAKGPAGTRNPLRSAHDAPFTFPPLGAGGQSGICTQGVKGPVERVAGPSTLACIKLPTSPFSLLVIVLRHVPFSSPAVAPGPATVSLRLNGCNSQSKLSLKSRFALPGLLRAPAGLKLYHLVRPAPQPTRLLNLSGEVWGRNSEADRAGRRLRAGWGVGVPSPQPATTSRSLLSAPCWRNSMRLGWSGGS